MLSFFDKLEDYVREHLSRHPIPYALIGGIAVVLFWRGVWESADMLMHSSPTLFLLFYPPIQIVIATLALMLMGLLVTIFIGDRIIISGLRREKKIEEQTERLVKEELVTIEHVMKELKELRREIAELKK